MTDRPTNESGTSGREQAVELLRSARERLEPMLAGALDALARDAGSPDAQTEGARSMSSGSFFAVAEFLNDLLARLQSAESESDLLHLFLDLSLIGFQGFELSGSAATAIDRLLAECEAIALTMTAGGDRAH